MSSAWERIAEDRIAEAFEQGEFENLPGKGRPLDLTAYFSTPSEDRMAFSILKSAGIVPSEVELMSVIAELERRFQNSTSEPEAHLLKQRSSWPSALSSTWPWSGGSCGKIGLILETSV
jgi:hypothetical protein